jgi:hypothetical protein
VTSENKGKKNSELMVTMTLMPYRPVPVIVWPIFIYRRQTPTIGIQLQLQDI